MHRPGRVRLTLVRIEQNPSLCQLRGRRSKIRARKLTPLKLRASVMQKALEFATTADYRPITPT